MNVRQATLETDIGDVATDSGAKRARRDAILGSAIGYATDGFDLLILGFMLRPISADLGLTQPQAASLVTATLFGAVLGGFSPLLVGLAASTRGFEFAISALALLYVVDLVTMWLLIPERRGAELE